MNKTWLLSIFTSFLLQSVCVAEFGIGTVSKAYAKWDFVVIRSENSLNFRARDFLVIEKGDGSVYYAIVWAVDRGEVIADVHRNSEPSTGDRVIYRFSYSSPGEWVTIQMPNQPRMATPASPLVFDESP